MGITNSNKVVSTDQILCDGSLRVTLALTAAPDILTSPTDIVLILDRSGSMAGEPLASMKVGAKSFIDIIQQSTNGAPGTIGSGSRMAVVSFASTATADTQLVTSVAELDAAIDSLSAGGSTNHADAFAKAAALLDPPAGNARVMVMFTDGNTTAGPPPAPIADAARDQGMIIYCIGLIGSSGLDVTALELWATDPSETHVAVTPNLEDLDDLFAELAANISKPGATNIVIDEVVNPDFQITSVLPPDKGAVQMMGPTALRWTIPSLGKTENEGATLEFIIQHISPNAGTKLVNQSITYTDDEGNLVVFPAPTVSVNCPVVVDPEPCPAPVELTVEGCADAVLVDVGDVCLEAPGRILQLDVTVKEVCPGRRVALAVILTETDSTGQEYPRGIKTFTLPAHAGPGCRDVLVRCVRFVVPEDISMVPPNPQSLCAPRNFKVRLIAHNIDTDFHCCLADPGQ